MVAKKGPASSLETGTADPLAADNPTSKGMNYAVQVHTAENGLEVVYVTAESGDEAAQKALKKHGYKDTSVRGVTPASDPDPNSLGGERDAAQMISNAENSGSIIDTAGTDANREAMEQLGRADIGELND